MPDINHPETWPNRQLFFANGARTLRVHISPPLVSPPALTSYYRWAIEDVPVHISFFEADPHYNGGTDYSQRDDPGYSCMKGSAPSESVAVSQVKRGLIFMGHSIDLLSIEFVPRCKGYCRDRSPDEWISKIKVGSNEWISILLRRYPSCYWHLVDIWTPEIARERARNPRSHRTGRTGKASTFEEVKGLALQIAKELLADRKPLIEGKSEAPKDYNISLVGRM